MNAVNISPSISTAGLNAILFAVQKMGLNVESIRKEAELTTVDLNDCELRLSCEYAAKIYRLAHVQWQGTHFGLHHGRVYQPFMLGIVGPLLASAATLMQALEGFVRYQKSFGEGIQLQLQEQANLVEAQLWVHPYMQQWIDHEIVDSFFIALVNCLNELTAPPVKPIRVELTRSLPESDEAYLTAFGCPVQFAQTRNCIVLKKLDLFQPLLLANHPLFEALQRQLQDVLDRLPAQDFLSQRVRAIILKSFNGEKLTMERLAQPLNVSPRTLQRRLRDEGKSFQQLLNEVRCEFASYHLRTKRIGIDELAYLLGYSESSIFRKSFKRWSGYSPSDYRRQSRPQQ